jgi:hypothetical protein
MQALIYTQSIKKPVIELHHYYICRYDNNIKGIELYSRDFVTISGPFISYDPSTQILESANNTFIYLPSTYADKTESPPVYSNTCKFLNQLIKIGA